MHELAVAHPPIKGPPPGMKLIDWAVRPEVRKVADVRNIGYSTELHEALDLVSRRHGPDRVRGRALIEAIEGAMSRRPCAMVQLVPWALRR